MLQVIMSFAKEGLTAQQVKGELERQVANFTGCYFIAVDVIIRHLQRNIPFALIINHV